MRIDRVSVADVGLSQVVVDTGALRAVFIPSWGGRLISLEAMGHEWIFRDADHLDGSLRPVVPMASWGSGRDGRPEWANVGGHKTWIMPQGAGDGEWPGPAGTVADSGAWDVSRTVAGKTAEIMLVSPVDTEVDVSLQRVFTFRDGDAAFTQVSTLTNTGRAAREWAIWEVVQLDTDDGHGHGTGVVEVAQPSGHRPTTLMDLRGSLDLGHETPDGWTIEVQDVIAKIGFPAASGRMAYRRPGIGTLSLDFSVAEHGRYPDGGCRGELWMQTPLPEPLGEAGNLPVTANYIELEPLSPLTRLEPGESVQLETEWRFASLADGR